MVVSLLIRAALIYFVFVTIRKIWKGFSGSIGHEEKAKRDQEHQAKSDIVEADYTVIDEKEIID